VAVVVDFIDDRTNESPKFCCKIVLPVLLLFLLPVILLCIGEKIFVVVVDNDRRGLINEFFDVKDDTDGRHTSTGTRNNSTTTGTSTKSNLSTATTNSLYLIVTRLLSFRIVMFVVFIYI
jgi:hypothetical protein